MFYPVSLSSLEEQQLLEQFSDLVDQDRSTNAKMLAHIAEIDSRRLWARHACNSMFAFCTERFHMSESMAGKRVWAARAAEKFPPLFEMIDRGEIHLSGILVLAKHLTLANHQEVLRRSKHKSKRQLEQLAAELAPKPDVPSRVRALPTKRPAPQAQTATAAWPLKPQAEVTPLAPRRYKLQVTMNQETRDKLTEAQELLSHQIPNGDPATIIDKALDALIDKARKQKAALTDRPRRSRMRSTGRTRTVSAAVRREVFKRDEGQCKYVDGEGNRCKARRFIEFHHKDPYALGGKPEATNIELRCQAHNQHQADLDYGELFMNAKRSEGRRPDP